MNKTISALAHRLIGGNQKRGGQTISYDGAMKEDCTVEGVGERIRRDFRGKVSWTDYEKTLSGDKKLKSGSLFCDYKTNVVIMLYRNVPASSQGGVFCVDDLKALTLPHPCQHLLSVACCAQEKPRHTGSVVGHTGLVTLQPVESSQTRRWTHARCIGRRILND